MLGRRRTQEKTPQPKAQSSPPPPIEKKQVSREEIQAMIARAANGPDAVSTELFHTIMIFAYNARASDVHFEPEEEIAKVRMRIDGLLHDTFELPKALHHRMIGLLKILTHMRTDEHRAAQDGRYAYTTEEEDVDVRVSLMPFTDGEKAVLRLLSGASHSLTLEQLGFAADDLARVQRAIKKPWGMILCTGPTGSGKTTSIYAILEILNKSEVNISTIEDPVEFYISGVNQSQVDQAAKMTFAKGLRALLRQDPDILLVGEIRDEETAKIAVNAALTGHKLLSTLHTNNAATTIPRLLDMGVEPFLVASTLLVAIGQRLLRRVCPKCVKSVSLTKAKAKSFISPIMLEELFGRSAKVSVAQAVGCSACNDTGYKGRVGIYEVIEVTDELKELIAARATSEAIELYAKKHGMTTMTVDGVAKVRARETTLEELLRVMQE